MSLFTLLVISRNATTDSPRGLLGFDDACQALSGEIALRGRTQAGNQYRMPAAGKYAKKRAGRRVTGEACIGFGFSAFMEQRLCPRFAVRVLTNSGAGLA